MNTQSQSTNNNAGYENSLNKLGYRRAIFVSDCHVLCNQRTDLATFLFNGSDELILSDEKDNKRICEDIKDIAFIYLEEIANLINANYQYVFEVTARDLLFTTNRDNLLVAFEQLSIPESLAHFIADSVVEVQKLEDRIDALYEYYINLRRQKTTQEDVKNSGDEFWEI